MLSGMEVGSPGGWEPVVPAPQLSGLPLSLWDTGRKERVSRKESDFLRHQGSGAEQLSMTSIFHNQDSEFGRQREKTTPSIFLEVFFIFSFLRKENVRSHTRAHLNTQAFSYAYASNVWHINTQ